MRRRNLSLTVGAIITSFILSGHLIAQKPKVPEEAWEKRLNRRQPPEKIIDAIGLKKGMVIGDIGAGTGRLAFWFSERVGETGRVYANDIDNEALNTLKSRCKKYNIRNITTIVGEVEDPLLPEKSLDIAFMINVYHHLDKPIPLVKNIMPSLKPDGILAIVECDPVKSGFPEDHSTPKNDMIKQLDQAGYDIIRIEDFLREDYIYICRPRGSEK